MLAPFLVPENRLEEMVGNLPLLRAIDPGLAGCSKHEIIQILESLPPNRQIEVYECLRAIHGLAQTKLKSLTSQASSLISQAELERPPQQGEMQAITLADCLVLSKMSKRDWDMRQAGCTEEELVNRYRAQGLKEDRIQRILTSHQEQVRSLELIEQQFKDAGVSEQRVFILDNLPHEEAQRLVDRYPMIMALGGDDSAKAVSHLIGADKLFCLINSDAGTSTGGLISFSRDDMPALFTALAEGNFLIQEWPRLEVEVIRGDNGRLDRFPPAISEVVITDDRSLYTLRASFNPATYQESPLESDLDPQSTSIHAKGSGLIVTTGAGSTGWFSSAAKYIYPNGRRFARTAQRFEYISREPYGEPQPEDEMTGTYSAGETMTVNVNSKHDPIVSGDSVWASQLKEGDQVRIRLSKQPLKVVASLRPQN